MSQNKKEKMRTHTPVEGYTIEDLRSKSINKLADIAKSLGIENPQEFLRQDLIFEILKTQVSQGGFILFTGILEITNGIQLISEIKLKQISINIILTAFLLGVGGISVLLQVLSIVSKSDLSMKPYIIGKILQGFFAAFYTFWMIQIFPVFNFNL